MSTLSTIGTSIETEAMVLAAKFVGEYGAVERFVAAHPKTSLLLAIFIAAPVAGFLGHLL